MCIDFDHFRINVLKRFDSKRKFGEHMGWNAPKVTRILRGYQFPRLDEIWRIAEKCNMTDEELIRTFFARDVR